MTVDYKTAFVASSMTLAELAHKIQQQCQICAAEGWELDMISYLPAPQPVSAILVFKREIMIWEYQTFMASTPHTIFHLGDEIKELCQGFGLKGWELVTVIMTDNPVHPTAMLIFKRPQKEP